MNLLANANMMAEWISIEDRLPEAHPGPVVPVSDNVLVFTRGQQISIERFFGIPGKWSGGYYEIGDFVSHWMPLPEPPNVPKQTGVE